MERYKHGIAVKESITKLATPKKGNSGVQVIFGTAPVNLINNPQSAVNKLIYCETMEDVVEKLGYSDDFENYTLCQSAYANFELFSVSPVIFINVLDPKKHKKTVQETTLSILNKQAVLEEKGVLLDTVTVKNGETVLNINTDYILTFAKNGNLEISLINQENANLITQIKVSAEQLNPKDVKAKDIIGGVDVQTGVETGLELIRQVYPRYGVIPSTLLAPAWSSDATVAAALQGKCEEINGKFKAICLVDLATSNATKYTDVEKVKKDIGASSVYTVALWPMVKVKDVILSYSAVYAALCQYLDTTNDNIPSVYPSNNTINVDAACLKDGTEVFLDEVQGNVLNSQGVVTIINQAGLRIWGNNTAAYPEVLDPQNRWIAIRRFFNWYSNSFIIRFLDNVDRPADYKLIEAFIDSENIYGNALVASGKIAGAKFEFNLEDNPKEQILEGKIVFREKIAPYIPAEYIENNLSFDPNMIADAIGGGK